MRVVTLPNGRKVGLGAYVSSWRKVIEIAANDPLAQIRGFDHFADDASRILRELRYGMHDRINKHVVEYGRGRKWSDDWQRETRHAANLMNAHRVIVRKQSIPAWIAAKLPHRVTHPREE